MPTDDQRAARRRYIRDHHPDRGGDPSAFAAGLDAFAQSTFAQSTFAQSTFAQSTTSHGSVTFYRRARGVRRLKPLAARAVRIITRAKNPPRVR